MLPRRVASEPLLNGLMTIPKKTCIRVRDVNGSLITAKGW